MATGEFVRRVFAVTGLDGRAGSVSFDAEQAGWEQPEATDEERVPAFDTTILADTQRSGLLGVVDMPVADMPMGFVALVVPALEEAGLINAPTGRIGAAGALGRNQWDEGVRFRQGSVLVLLKPAKGGAAG